MQENSFEWFTAQIESVREHVDKTWPDWMKNTSDTATASFPVVGSTGSKREACAGLDEQVTAPMEGIKSEN
jgi:hypothetical protein